MISRIFNIGYIIVSFMTESYNLISSSNARKIISSNLSKNYLRTYCSFISKGLMPYQRNIICYGRSFG